MSFELIFWTALGILVYTWFGYPVLLWACERLMYMPVRRGECEPRLSILVVAHDEEEVIAAKLDNLLDLDYPQEKLEIVVASDGSHDRTAEIVKQYADRGVRLRDFPVRRGKPSVLNDVVPALAGEIVLLVDARQRLEPDVARKLAANFADPAVGGVSGELVFEKPEQVGMALSMDTYWRYEKWLRNKEAGIHSTVGGTGAIFALRKELFRPLPGETILDDVVLPLQIVKRGLRVVMDMGARAWDTANATWQREFVRKARTLSGNWQILFNFRRMGCGVLGPVSFQYYSHKVMRLLGPFCLVALFVSNWQLARMVPDREAWPVFYSAFLAGQIIFYLAATAGFFMRGALLKIPFIAMPNAFMLMQVAVAVGLLRYCSGRDDALWDKSHALDPASMRQRLFRLFIDSFIFTAGFVLAYYIRYLGPPPQEALDSYMGLFPHFNLQVPVLGWFMRGPVPTLRLAVPLVMLIPLAVFYFFRINEPRTEEVTPEYFLTLIKGVVYATMILFLLIYVRRASLLQTMQHDGTIQVVSIPTSTLIIGFVLNCILIGGWRILLSVIRNSSEEAMRDARDLLFIGDAALPEAELDRVEAAFTPQARLITLRPDTHEGSRVTPAAELDNCLSMVRPDGILVATPLVRRDRIMKVISTADRRNLPADILPGEIELLLAGSNPRLTSYIPVIEPGHSSIPEIANFAKFLIDFTAGLLSLTGIPFLMALVLASRRIAPSGRHVRIKGVCRIGRRGRLFVSPRLRFTHGWPKWWVWLARWSLLGSELLKGQRSLVGPRPLLTRNYLGLSPLGKRFLSCKPGIFSLQRVLVFSRKILDKRAAAVVYYARYRNLAMDMQIILQSIRLQTLNERKKNESSGIDQPPHH